MKKKRLHKKKDVQRDVWGPLPVKRITFERAPFERRGLDRRVVGEHEQERRSHSERRSYTGRKQGWRPL